ILIMQGVRWFAATFVARVVCPDGPGVPSRAAFARDGVEAISRGASYFPFPAARESTISDDRNCRSTQPAFEGDPMNSPKVVVSLGLAIIFSVILAACGGSKYTPPPPGPPIIQTDSLPHGAVNASYGINGLGAILSAAGGTGAYTWSISTGPLPPGLSLNASQGVILGTPTTV